MDGFERRKEQKKTDILESALDLFINHGVQKVSIAEIAKKANVSQVTIYNYFESKHNLVNETIVYYINKAWEKGEKILDSNIPYLDKITQIIFARSETANKIHEDFYLNFMNEYASGASYFEEFYNNIALPRLIEFFNEGKDEGYINQEISSEAILFYFNMFKEYLQKKENYEHVLPLTEDLTKLFFYGIAGKSDN